MMRTRCVRRACWLRRLVRLHAAVNQNPESSEALQSETEKQKLHFLEIFFPSPPTQKSKKINKKIKNPQAQLAFNEALTIAGQQWYLTYFPRTNNNARKIVDSQLREVRLTAVIFRNKPRKPANAV